MNPRTALIIFAAAVSTIAAVAIAVWLTGAPCKPGDDGAFIGNMLIAGCPK